MLHGGHSFIRHTLKPRERQMARSPLCIWVRNSSNSLCNSPNKALYIGERSTAIQRSIHEISRETDTHTQWEWWFCTMRWVQKMQLSVVAKGQGYIMFYDFKVYVLYTSGLKHAHVQVCLCALFTIKVMQLQLLEHHIVETSFQGKSSQIHCSCRLVL